MLPKKMLLFYYLLILLQGLAISNSAKLNGGLAFSESDKNGQIYVNLNQFLATRSADILNHISSFGMDIVNRYYAHCNQVSNLLSTYKTNQTQNQMIQKVLKEVNPEIHDEIIVPPIQVSLIEAPKVCKSIGAHLPEIITVGQKEYIRIAALKHKIRKIYAGVRFENLTKRFRFIMDQKSARTGSPFN